jgi:predicted DsbA family dithiol-disulfide isomerase
MPRPRLQIPVYYDFASTLCYVAHRVMERMGGELADLGIELLWQPVDLVRITGWPRGVVVDGPRRDNALRVAGELDVPVRMPPRWLDSRPAHAVSLQLLGSDKEVAWRERVWTAVFEEGRAIDAAGELDRLGRDLQIDVAASLAAAQAERLETETRLAREAGVTGVPTFLLDGWPLGGIQEDFTMRSLFQRFVRKRERDGER